MWSKLKEQNIPTEKTEELDTTLLQGSPLDDRIISD